MKTFEEWSKAGYKINKGSKGIKSGNAYYFTEAQVTFSPRYPKTKSTFKGCTPKGTSGWSIHEYADEEDDMSNPLAYDYRGFGY